MIKILFDFGFLGKTYLIRIKKIRITTRARELLAIKEEIASHVHHHLNHIVSMGPFNGLKFSDKLGWGNQNDLTSQLLGFYELEVVKLIHELASHDRVFIDIGAANGFYAVGVAKCFDINHVYCYEMTEWGRSAILNNAIINNVQHKLSILGKCDQEALSKASCAYANSSCIVLVDIEGGEFKLLDKNAFQLFRYSDIIVELHDWMSDDLSATQKMLINSSETHHHSFFRNNGRDPMGCKLISHLPEDYQWLACSESRERSMQWVHFQPLKHC
jgi:hypothetical protein